ncbi:MAG: cyclic nucleotide-binding domain-containing protein, partial [Actinomycetota bacterium]|nr:cyclic nucleotide-binding domain-containing protein [Actinomycetota bacterium]
RLAPDEVLVEEGDYHERLLVVLDGQLEQTSIDAAGNRARILVFDPGQFHGYMAVMSNSREAHSISATETSTIVEFNKASVLRLMREAEAFGERMEALYRDRALWSHARSSPVLRGLDENAVEDLLDDAQFRILEPGEVLYREGDPASDMYLVRDGFLRVARKFKDDERVLQYFREGDVCGLNAILFEQPQTATISANTRSEIIEVPAASLLTLLDRHPEVRVYMSRQIEQVEHIDLTKEAPKATTENLIPLEGLLDEGIVQGTEVLLINTAICVNCNNCVDSCERRHGYSRLHRSGLQLDELLFPSACRHCEDPVCLLCSVNGIVRLPDGEIRIVSDNCIGCGACAERCPYGNINMHFRDQKDKGGRRRLLDFFTSHMDEDETMHLAEIKGKRVAAKCDLCAGYDDYACVTGCPVGAAMRVNPVDIFGGTDVIVGLENKKAGQTT